MQYDVRGGRFERVVSAALRNVKGQRQKRHEGGAEQEKHDVSELLAKFVHGVTSSMHGRKTIADRAPRFDRE
jgi:hypothetical protein